MSLDRPRRNGIPALCGAVLAVVAAAPVAAGEAAEWKWTAEAVVDTVGVGNVALSPDGTSIVFTRTRWRPADAKPGPAFANLWRVAFGGGEPQRLTTADAEDQRPRFSPDASRIAFLSRRGESAKTRVWILPTTGGEAEALTDEKTDVSAFEWSPDGKSIAYVAVDLKSEDKEKDEKAGKDAVVVDQDLRPRRLWTEDVASKKAEKLASLGDLSAWDFDWAPDGAALVASVTERNRTDDSYMLRRIVVLPLKGERRELVPVLGKVGDLAWSKGGKTIAWLAGVDSSDPSTGSLFVVPAAGGTPRNLTGGREETAGAIAWRKDGRIAVASIVGTRTAVWIVEPAAGTWENAVAAGPVVFGPPSFSADGMRYALAGATSTESADIYSGSLPGPVRQGGKPPAARPPKKITASNPQLDGLPRGEQSTFRYKAEDGLEVEGVLIKPVGFKEGTRNPLVVIAHGGPESQYLDGWNNSYFSPGHALAERGYLVFFPNYRGSTGRGVAYAKANHKDLGGKEFSDVLDGVDALAAKGWVDPKRVGITGGSYGGYFTALGVTRHSNRFAAGVELFGISDWESFLGQSDIPMENSLVHWALWCYDQPALCRERSAIGNLDRARTPTLILQGREDDRVPKPQSDELYAALRFKQVPVEYVVYPREGHGFRERWHRIDCVLRLLGWMDRYLGGGPRG